MKVVQFDESTHPENYYLEDLSNPGAYTVVSEVVTWIDGASKTLIKKAWDGVQLFAAFDERVELYFRRDIDKDPVHIATLMISGSVNNLGTWYDQWFKFDPADPEVTMDVKIPKEKYWVTWEKFAFGDTNYFAMQWHFTKGIFDLKMMIYSPEREVTMDIVWDVRDSAFSTNRSDGRGVKLLEEVAGVQYTTASGVPKANWSRYTYAYGPTTCSGQTDPVKTVQELYQLDMGLTI